MNLILALLAASATGLQPSAPPPVPDWAATLVPVSLDELRHFADALSAIAARAGMTPAQALSPSIQASGGKLAPAERMRIIRAHALSPARFDYIAAQVRYNERMARVVNEELRLASVQPR
jgi:hypothetical protein